MIARPKNLHPAAPRAEAATAADGRRGRGEAARRALAEGLERSRRLVDRYRALLLRLHNPATGARRLTERAHRLTPRSNSPE